MHLPAATIRTQVMLPLRFADGFGTTARVYTFEGLADGRGASRPRPGRRRRCLRIRRSRSLVEGRHEAHTLDLPCDDVLDAEA